MNKVQMNLMAVLAQVGFSNISKEQVRDEIEKNFTGKAEALASVNTLLEIEKKYDVLSEQMRADKATAQEELANAYQELQELDVTTKDAVAKMMELETKKAMAEAKVKASDAVIKSLDSKKNAELVAELPNTYKTGLNAKSQAFMLLGQITNIANPFNIKLISEVLAEVDAQMYDVDHHYHRVARATGVLGTVVNGAVLHERDLYTNMAVEIKSKVRK